MMLYITYHSNQLDEIFKTMKDQTNNMNNGGFNLESLLNNPNVQNLLNNEAVMNFASQMTSQIVTSKVLTREHFQVSYSDFVRSYII
jgi:hypothetical protein